MNRVGTGLSIAVTLWPNSSSSAAFLSVSSRTSGLASRRMDCVTHRDAQPLLAWVGDIADRGQLRIAVTRSISR